MVQIVLGRIDNRRTVDTNASTVREALANEGFVPTANEVVVNAEGDQLSMNIAPENGGWYLLSQHTKSGE